MSTLVDAGPLVALINRTDDQHEAATSLFARASRPWLTCEAVLSETFFLLRQARRGRPALRELLARQALMVAYSVRGDEPALLRLMEKYDDVPISLADACLVRMSELHGATPLLTFDSDFSVYRTSRRRVVPLLE